MPKHYGTSSLAGFQRDNCPSFEHFCKHYGYDPVADKQFSSLEGVLLDHYWALAGINFGIDALIAQTHSEGNTTSEAKAKLDDLVFTRQCNVASQDAICQRVTRAQFDDFARSSGNLSFGSKHSDDLFGTDGYWVGQCSRYFQDKHRKAFIWRVTAIKTGFVVELLLRHEVRQCRLMTLNEVVELLVIPAAALPPFVPDAGELMRFMRLFSRTKAEHDLLENLCADIEQSDPDPVGSSPANIDRHSKAVQILALRTAELARMHSVVDAQLWQSASTRAGFQYPRTLS